MRIGKYLLRGTVLAVIACGLFWFWLLHSESGAAWAWSRVESALGGQLAGQFAEGDLNGGLSLRDVHFANDTIEVRVESTQLSIDVDFLPVTIRLSDVSLAKIDVALKPSVSETGAELDVEELLTGLRLPLRLDLTDANLSDVEVLTTAGESLSVSQLTASVFWHNSIVIRSFAIENGADSAAAHGEIGLVEPQLFNLTVSAEYQGVAAQADVSGDQRSAKVDSIDVRSADIEATGTARIQWDDGLTGQGGLVLDRLNLNSMTEVWPASHPLNGEFNVELTNDVVRVSGARVAAENSKATVQFDAELDRAAASVFAQLQWLNFQWPVDALIPDFHSSDGTVSVSGDLDQWTVDGVIAVGAAAMPDGRFQIRGGGDRNEVALNIEDGFVFGGTIAGDVGYSWRAEQAWTASVEFADLQTSGLVPEWPGVVTGRAHAEGTQSPLAVNVMLDDVSGEVRGQALAANGAVAYSDDVARADWLLISHGGSRLLLNGSADSEEGLTFEGSVDTIESYFENAAGGFRAEGRVSRLEASPYLSVDLRSEELLIGGVLLRDISVTDTRHEDAIAGVTVNIAELAAAGQNVAAIAATVDFRRDWQSLSLAGTNRDTNISLAIDGAFDRVVDDWQQLLSSPWRGNVSEFSVDLEDAHTLRLEQAAALELSSERVALERFCLVDEVASQLCLDLSRDVARDYALQAELVAVPLALLEHVVDAQLNFDQRVNGKVVWSGNPDAGATGTGRFELSAGTVTDSRRERFSLATGVGHLAFEITNGDLLAGTATIPFPGVGGIGADFEVLELTDVASSGLNGHVNIEMNDVAILALMLPEIDAAGGRMHADLELAGTGSKPLLTGQFEWQEGVIEYAPLGLRLDDINLASNLTKNRSIELSGSFRSGDGRGEIVSSADYSDTNEPGLHFYIRGDELLLVNVPNIQLNVRPDLRIDYSKKTLSIGGSLHIPTARIAPSNLSASRIDESDDVVIVAGAISKEAAVEKEEQSLRYEGQFEITLGKEVVIDLDIATAELSGGAVFAWSGPPLPTVVGRYDLQGSVQAFGQVLQITEGAIRYANVAVTEPQMRIKAEREIYGNSQVKRAGVLIDGLATRPTIQAYTYPITTEERALTLLVTGSDFDLEQGVGAIDFGTYIAPKLFVSYGVGIFDQENVISARYDLAKGFGVKATSGSKQSGLDLNYKFEN